MPFEMLIRKIIFLVFVFIVFLEIALRVLFGLGSPVLYVGQGDYGYFPAANLNLKRFGATVTTNQFGMRSPTYNLNQNDDCRIMFLGDSVTFGTTQLDQKDIFVSLVGEALQKKQAYPVHILNASAPGWAPQNILAYVSREGIYQSQTVIIVLNTKDLTQLFAPFEKSAVFPDHRPVLALQELLMRYILPRLFPSLVVLDPGSTQASQIPTAQDRVRLVSVLREAASLIHKQSGRAILVYVPSETDDIRVHPEAWQHAAEGVLNDVASDFAAEIDLSKLWTVSERRNAYLDGIHLSRVGNQLAAREIVKTLEFMSPCSTRERNSAAPQPD